MNIGNKINDLRKEKGITQDELAAQMGVTAAAVSKWENGYTLPDILMLCALADFFQVSTDELLGRKTQLRSAVISADDSELCKQIEAVAKQHGIYAARICTDYYEALDAAVSSHADYLLMSSKKAQLELETWESPDGVHVIVSLGNTEQETLMGFEMLLRELK